MTGPAVSISYVRGAIVQQSLAKLLLMLALHEPGCCRETIASGMQCQHFSACMPVLLRWLCDYRTIHKSGQIISVVGSRLGFFGEPFWLV